MKITDMLREEGAGLSCELFPPKQGTKLDNAFEIVRSISSLGVDFISVTYGAGGTTAGKTVAIASEAEKCGTAAMAHLTCINADEEKIDKELSELKKAGVENVLALRGDIPEGYDMEHASFRHASDLAARIRAFGGFAVGGACYPEGHPESSGLNDDIENTKRKIDSGVEFLVTQMFFDNDVMYNYMYRLLAHSVTVPVIPGIMPVTNASQIRRICLLSGTRLPAHFRAIVERFGDDPLSMRQAGIAYATAQTLDLIANGFKDVHIYTMNRPEIIGGIMANLSHVVKKRGGTGK